MEYATDAVTVATSAPEEGVIPREEGEPVVEEKEVDVEEEDSSDSVESLSTMRAADEAASRLEGGREAVVGEEQTEELLCMIVNQRRQLTRTVVGYDERMLKHCIIEGIHPERPMRIAAIVEELRRSLKGKFMEIHGRVATDKELLVCHTQKHLNYMAHLLKLSVEELDDLEDSHESVYFSPGTELAARVAVGTLIDVTTLLMKNRFHNGAAVIRPPGHHCESHRPRGFCYYNNVPVAAHHALQMGAKRVLIVDWDVHHGNGIQDMFYDDPRVLYISLHRYDEGTFYPSGTWGSMQRTGQGAGVGYNINIPWECDSVGDHEYLYAFERVIMPIARQFDPDMVFVSSGFDAAEGDPLGGCSVTPAGYAHMTHHLMSLASGRVLVALEGGYYIKALKKSMKAIVQTLAGDRLPRLKPLKGPLLASCVQVVEDVRRLMSEQWSCLPSIDVSTLLLDSTLAQLPPENSLEAATDAAVQAVVPAVDDMQLAEVPIHGLNV
eukprot:m.241486 g.241486  ORF g.241486 m.241486 type:complete len:495 (-) comp15325_c0_seq4:296-1780(-)